MKNITQNQNARREAQESSVQSFPMKEVNIPSNIIAPNHRRAYAAAFVAAFTGRKLAFVAPVVRHSICRGWFAGEEARRNWNRFTGPQFYNAHA